MNLQVVAGSFQGLKYVENRNWVGGVERVNVHFAFKTILSTVYLRINVDIDAATTITQVVCA